mgnify:CR=1 FL=1
MPTLTWPTGTASMSTLPGTGYGPSRGRRPSHPHHADSVFGIADDLCMIRSMHTGHNGHEVSIRYINAGIPGVTGRPSLGAWLSYGLGSENQNLPGFVVLKLGFTKRVFCCIVPKCAGLRRFRHFSPKPRPRNLNAPQPAPRFYNREKFLHQKNSIFTVLLRIHQ